MIWQGTATIWTKCGEAETNPYDSLDVRARH